MYKTFAIFRFQILYKGYDKGMILIFGGAYQGKYDYLLDNFELFAEDIYVFSVDDTNYINDKKAIYGLQDLIRYYIECGQYDEHKFKNEIDEYWKDKIIVCDDISSGIVPIDYYDREWRESVGRIMSFISERSGEVHRLFCGIGTRIK